MGTFGKHEIVCIKETEEKELIIYIPETGEIVAKHNIPDGKGLLIKDRNHSRDRTKGIDTFMDTVSQQFDDSETAYNYLQTVKEKHPRYVRDQLQMILKETKVNNKEILSAAFNECIQRSLYGATDFSDVVSYLKRHRQVEDTVGDTPENVSRIKGVSGWVMETEAQKREVDAYTAILEGEPV